MNFSCRRLVLSLVAAILCSCGGGGQPSHGPGFSIAASPATLVVVPGASETGTVTVSPHDGFTGGENVTISNVPAGVTVAPNPIQFSISSSPVSQPITVSAGFDAQLHNTTLPVTGTGGNMTASASLNLQVRSLSVTTWHYDNGRTGVNPNRAHPQPRQRESQHVREAVRRSRRRRGHRTSSLPP